MTESEKEKVRANPYKYITEEWAEASLLYVGRKSFSIIALQPCSLIIPEIPFGSKSIPATINNFLVGSSGIGKSSICDKTEKISYFALKRRDISAPELQQKAIQMEMMTLIIEDFSQFGADYEKVKVLEGIIGEEHSVNKSNLRTELLGDTHAIALLCGTIVDLERYAKQLEGGLLSRCVFNMLTLTPKEHGSIGDFINLHAGDKDYAVKQKMKEETVMNFYDELFKIQSRQHEINPVVEYNIDIKFKKQAGEIWKSLSDKLIRDLGEKSYIRDLNYYYKFLVSSAFLNIFNRKLEEIDVGRDAETGKILRGSILYPNEEDHKLAIQLMKQNMKNKWALDKAMWYKKNTKTLEMFKKILNEEKTGEVKTILLNISPYARMVQDSVM